VRFDVVSLFPEMLEAVKSYGVTGRAVRQGLIDVEVLNPRDFTHDKHRTVDDRPFGGGPGMVMKVQPLQDALLAAKAACKTESRQVIYLSPQGKTLTHELAESLKDFDQLILIAGRYEGIDERLIETEVDMEVSIGDFVLSGGELPAMVLIDSVSRLIPGVLGHAESAVEDSFADGLLDHPHYTRPDVVNGLSVPDVLLSGHHEKIAEWRQEQALRRTFLRRPDLLDELDLSEEQQVLLKKFKQGQL
jgi:tRNA (guanine37-N1)-methyltransferase